MRGRQNRAGGRKSTANTSPGEFQNDARSATKGCANDSRRRQECDSMKQYQKDQEKDFLEPKDEHFRHAKVGKTLRTSLKNHANAHLSSFAVGNMAKVLQRRRQRSQRGALERSQVLKNIWRHAPHQEFHTGEHENAKL